VQVPGYAAKKSELIAKGVEEVLVYCVNDGAVMKAWAADQKVDGTLDERFKGSMISFLADTRCEFTKAVGMEMTHPGPMDALGGVRCKRFVLIVEDGVVKHVLVSEADGDPAGDNDAEGPIAKATMVDAVLALL
jgi:peroxiredoxin